MKNKKSLKPDAVENEYVVVVRGPSGVIFHEDQHFIINKFLHDNTRVDLLFRTRYTKIEGVEELIPRSLWVEIRGRCSSINKAISIFANAALTLAEYFSFCVNAPIGDLQPELAFDNTPNIKKREYFQQFVTDERIRPYMGRIIDIASTEDVFRSIMHHADHERIYRAIVHYAQALKYWNYGKDIFSLAHLYMGMEALTPIALRKYMEDNKLDKNGLIAKWGIEKKQLDSEIRQRILFKNDTDTFQKAREASDTYEHSYDALSKVWNLASSVKKKTAEYLRSSILELSNADEATRNKLLCPPFDKPFSLDFAKYLRGFLIGDAEHLGTDEQEYPIIRWESKPVKVIKSTDEILIMNDEKFTPMIAEKLGFQSSSLEIWGGPEREIDKTIRKKIESVIK